MMDKDELTIEILRLTLLCQQGNASEDESARLNVLLADSSDARLMYLCSVDDSVTLVDTSSSATTESQETERRNVTLTEEHRNTTSAPIDDAPLVRRPELNVRRHLFLALAICLLVGLGLSMFDWQLQDRPSVATGTLPFKAMIVNLANVEWSHKAERYQEWTVVSIGEKIRFDAGVVELILDNGAQIVLQGPADFSLVSPQKAIVRQGQLVVRCGPDAVGFEIESPDASVIDLGTEFGMSVVEGTYTDVVVYEGAVDLSVRAAAEATEHRLTAGEALHIARNGDIQRIASVRSNIFLPPRDLLGWGDGRSDLIESVSDSLHPGETSKFYRIIGGGFTEDCRAYVDRFHEWNGLDSQGIPRFLRGGDYVMTFNDDKIRQIQVALEVTRPVHLYVLMDDRVSPPDWLTTDFNDTGWDIGLDSHIVVDNAIGLTEGQLNSALGPGQSVDRTFSVWQRDVPDAMVVELGGLRADDLGDIDPHTVEQSMYGIVVTPMDGRQEIE